jgi:hypothetical protein
VTLSSSSSSKILISPLLDRVADETGNPFVIESELVILVVLEDSNRDSEVEDFF